MKKQKGFTLVELVVTLVALVLVPVILGGLGYVAYHFIAKFW